VWDVETGKDIMTQKHDGEILSVKFSPEDLRLAFGSNDTDGSIRLWDADKGTEIMALKGHFRGVEELLFSPDRKRLISKGGDGRVKLWDVSTGTEVMSFGAAGLVSISPDGKTIAIGKAGGITLLESEAPADGYENRRIGAAARKVVDELHEEHGLYSKVIDKLNADETFDESVRKVALQIANANLWEDEGKKQ
jgi:WD40 repeat protein